MIAHFEEGVPDNWVVWPGLCKQHATGLAMAPAAKELALVNPSFCTAKQFKKDSFLSDVVSGLRDVIAEDFQWIRVWPFNVVSDK